MSVSQGERPSALIFDCDGVLLNSNRIKTAAFAKVALPFGADVAEALVRYHVQFGGISRYIKFKYLLANILQIEHTQTDVQRLVESYGEIVYRQLLTCDVAPNLELFRRESAGIPWMVVSGSDQKELRQIFQERGLTALFDGGIFGSPKNKDEIFLQLKREGHVQGRTFFIGDSQYDHEAADRAGLQFLFMSDWSEFKEWSSYCQTNQIRWFRNLGEVFQSNILCI